MRSAIALALAAGALAVPHKRDVVTHYDVVYETDVVTVWANAEPSSSVAVAAVDPEPTSASSVAAVPHYGHNHWSNNHWSQHQDATSQAATTPSSTYVPPPTTSTYVAPTTSSSPPPPPPPPSSTPPPAPTTTSSPPPPPPPSSTYVAPAPSSTWAAPSSAQAAPAAPAKPSGYSQTVVYHHNLHRANHSAPDIQWDAGLAATAELIASSCKYAHNVEANGGGYGQNIAAGVEAANVSAIITNLFYNGEVGWYEGQYGKKNPDMSNFEHWGHFSQIVWKDTTHVGCATHNCGRQANGNTNLGNTGNSVEPWFTVCNYKNPGNFADQYGKNIGESLNKETANWDTGL